MKSELKGIMPAICTACNDKGELDESSQRRLVKFCIDNGVHGITVSAFGGEFYKFSDDERKKLLDVVIDETNGKVPVIAGSSHSGTRPALMLSKYAQDAGADAVMVLPPYLNKTESALGLRAHYEEIARAIDLPIVLQDSENETQVHMCPTLVSSLAKGFSNIRYVKVEGTLSPVKMSELKGLPDSKIDILGGDGGERLIQEFDLGAKGFITTGSTSRLCVDIYKNLEKRDIDRANELFGKLQIFLRFLTLRGASWIHVEKQALLLMGIINSSHVRLPTIPLTGNYVSEIRSMLETVGLLS